MRGSLLRVLGFQEGVLTVSCTFRISMALAGVAEDFQPTLNVGHCLESRGSFFADLNHSSNHSYSTHNFMYF